MKPFYIAINVLKDKENIKDIIIKKNIQCK